MQDRDDKYEGSEDSEYRFSDEDVSYEVETEHSKAAPAGDAKEPMAGGGGGITTSKRMMISLVVFLGLVFVAYKIISPSSQQAAVTDISGNTPVIAQQNPPAIDANKPQQAAPTTSQAPAVAMQQAVNNMPANQPTPVTNQAPTTPPAMPIATAPAQQATTAMAPPAPVATLPVPGSPPATQQPPPAIIQQAPVSTAMQSPPPPQQQPSAVPATPGYAPAATTMPTVIPIAAPSMPNMPAPATTTSAATEANIATLQTKSDQLVGQLQAEYTQKINDYATQNRALQEQIQTLTSRMATMESQFTQLLQKLTQKQEQPPAQPMPPTSMNMPATQPAAPMMERPQHISYNVQAIIPGRAWLRSDNGETITVAEGDVIKDLGRITKIDPYDGVVEINTGTKTVALSYGAAA